MRKGTLALDRVTYASVRETCEQFVRSSNSLCALLVGQDGLLLHSAGTVAGLDVEGLSALAAGTFASIQEMADRVGEKGFGFILQQGRQHHLQLLRVGSSAILLAVFDDRAAPGMVRLRGQRAVRRLAELFGDAEAAAEQEAEASGAWPGAVREADESALQFGTSLRLRTISLAVALLAAIVAVVGALLRS